MIYNSINMSLGRKEIIQTYLRDPSFSHYYFRDEILKNSNQILNVLFNGSSYHFSVERLTMRIFDKKSYREFRKKQVFQNPSYRMVLFLQGDTSLYIQGEKRTVQENTLFLLSPGPQISVTPKEPSECMVLEFYFDLINEDNKRLGIHFLDFLELISGVHLDDQGEIFNISSLHKDELRVLFTSLLKELKESHPYNGLPVHSAKQFKVHRVILDIFSYLLDHILLCKGDAENQRREQLVPVIKVLTEEFSKQHTITELAQIACLSSHYFQNLFKKEYGISPIAFLNRIRIREAMKMLKNSQLKCNEIAVLVGIPNPFYFSKLFRKITGQTPSEFRRSGL